MYDVNTENLIGVLNASKEKLESKGIDSIKARIRNLKNYMNENLSKDEFFEKFKREIFKQSAELEIKKLNKNEMDKIEEIMKKRFDNYSWTFGENHAYSFKNSVIYPAGKVEVFLDIGKDNIIKKANFFGDYIFDAEEISEALKDKPFNKKTIKSLEKVFYKTHIFDGVSFQKILELFAL